MQNNYRHLFLIILFMGVISPVWSCAQNINPQVARLAKAIKYYQQIASANKWATFPENICLRPSDSSEYVLKLRQNLALTQDLPLPDTSTGFKYDKALTAAVIRFQERHGLRPDGVVGQQTLKALNVTPAQRIRQMEFNLLRWQADTVGLASNRILLNIPDFKLKLLDGNYNIIWQTRVIVGHKNGKQTKLLRSKISYLVLNPTWNIPASIIRNEIIPVLKKDPNYLARKNMILYRVKKDKKYPISVNSVNWNTAEAKLNELMIIQSPGKDNALGQIKFIFDNPYSIYLHDTPEKSLFEHDIRDYSHGCVRVQNPELLAAYLLNQNWSQKPPPPLVIRKSQSEKIVFLPKPMPIKISYFTSWVNEQGLVQFREDIYKLDNFGADFNVLGLE